MVRFALFVVVSLVGCGGPSGPVAGADCSAEFHGDQSVAIVQCSGTTQFTCCGNSAPCGASPRQVWVQCSMPCGSSGCN